MFITALFLAVLGACCHPPDADFVNKPYAQKQMANLKDGFLAMLPPSQTAMPAARAEAAWLADTAVIQSAAIARRNKAVLFGWMNNILVNSSFRERGLCWHYQQDLYRDLRKKPLKYFHLGMTVRDRGTGREHSCVYVNAAGKGLQDSLVLDAWKNCGHLVVLTQQDRESRVWEEDWREPYVAAAFPEGHSYGINHHLHWPKWTAKTPWYMQRQNKLPVPAKTTAKKP